MNMTEAMLKIDEDTTARLFSPQTLHCQLNLSIARDTGLFIRFEVYFELGVDEAREDEIRKSPEFFKFLVGASLSSDWDVS